MERDQIIGVDLGGTNLRAGIVSEGALPSVISRPFYAHENALEQIFDVIDKIINEDVKVIGIGVPGLVDPSTKVLYDVVNIPSLNEINLQAVLAQRYKLPVKIENDANCFALGEFYFGSGRQHESVVGLTIGTGLGTGIILNSKLVTGKYGGAGEFGMIKYLDKNIEYYVSGRFFEQVYHIKGDILYNNALADDAAAIEIYGDFGRHLGEAIKLILYALDTECFIIGGAVKAAFPFYSKSMWETVGTFEYKRAISTLKIEASSLVNGNILGAAALHLHQ
jgi:glucokinase